jgi:hypothetical protein
MENPNVTNITSISIPVIDRKNNIVLIYIGTSHGWENGAGNIIALKYENGTLQELSRVMLWIS